jgi:rod shape-determining protein MreC
MENIFGRYGKLIVLLVVVLVQVVGLAVQVERKTDEGSSRLIRVWAISAITPVQKGIIGSGQWVRGLWGNYFYLRGVRNENERLKDEIERMRIEQVRLNEQAAQAQRVLSLLEFKQNFISQTVAAQVIGSSGSELSRLIYIDKGSNQGIQPDMPVITPDGIVGKVVNVFPGSAQVLQINDQSSGVGAILGSSRLHGILKGTSNGETMLHYIMSDESIKPGDQVITSGGDRIFPKGLPVGIVTQVDPGPELFLNIRVKPAADLNRLEEVLVVTAMAEQQAPATEQQAITRASDILAERLPGVKPKAPEIIPGAQPGTLTPSGTQPKPQPSAATTDEAARAAPQTPVPPAAPPTQGNGEPQ